MDYDKWTTADLRRYYTLLAHVLDAEVFAECALSDTEARELERFRLGIAERIQDHPTPRRVHDEPSVTTERAFVEQESRASNIATLVPRFATDASDIEPEPEVRVLSPAPARAAPRPKPTPAPALTAEDWDACGMYLVDGIPSTIFGDARAQQILSGKIPIEQAKREEQARRHVNTGRPGLSSPYL